MANIMGISEYIKDAGLLDMLHPSPRSRLSVRWLRFVICIIHKRTVWFMDASHAWDCYRYVRQYWLSEDGTNSKVKAMRAPKKSGPKRPPKLLVEIYQGWRPPCLTPGKWDIRNQNIFTLVWILRTLQNIRKYKVWIPCLPDSRPTPR